MGQGTTYYSYDMLPMGPYARQGNHLPTAHVPHKAMGKRNIQNFFVSESLRQDLAKRSIATLSQSDPEAERSTPVPIQVHHPPSTIHHPPACLSVFQA